MVGAVGGAVLVEQKTMAEKSLDFEDAETVAAAAAVGSSTSVDLESEASHLELQTVDVAVDKSHQEAK